MLKMSSLGFVVDLMGGFFLRNAIFINYKHKQPVPVAARSKAYVCGRFPAEIVGSNPTGGTDVCLL